MDKYLEFLRSKIEVAPVSGFDVDPGRLHPNLKPHQRDADQKRKDLTMHVCPLQLDIVDRIINRYSNPDDLVLDPFGGLGTVALEAMKAGRRGYTIELNNSYFRDAVGYLKAEEESLEAPTLFDMMGGA